MNYNDIQFEFKGFNPNGKIQKLVSAVAENLYFSAPSDSFLKVAVKKGKGAFQASCEIASSTGTFVAETVSNSSTRAVRLLEKKITEQLESWKQRRFKKSQKYGEV